MLKVLSNILCDLGPKVKVIGQKAGICDGVPSTSALVVYYSLLKFRLNTIFCQFLKARVFFLVQLPPLAVLDCACFQNQHIPFLNSSVHR